MNRWVLVLIPLFVGIVLSKIIALDKAQAQNYNSSPALVRMPLSGAAWNPPDQVAQQQIPNQQQLDRIEQMLTKILKMLEEAAGPPDGAKATVKEPPQALLDALGTCVQCHAQSIAQKKGDGFILFLAQKDEDGKDQNVLRDDFDARELRRIIREVDGDTMPKRTSGAKLTKDQKASLLAEMRTLLARKEDSGK